MDDGKIKEIIQKLDRGEISRNRHYEVFEDPLHAKARAGQKRLACITRLLSQFGASERGVVVQTQYLEAGFYRVTVRVPQFGFLWEAKLKQFELDLLKSRPGLNAFFSVSQF